MFKRCVNIINKLECCRNMFNVCKYCARMHNYCQTCFTDAQLLVYLLHLFTYIRLLPIVYCLLNVDQGWLPKVTGQTRNKSYPLELSCAWMLILRNQ